jgi:hypothetical protein
LGKALTHLIGFFDSAPPEVMAVAHAVMFTCTTGAIYGYSSQLAAYLLDHEEETQEVIKAFRHISRNLKMTETGDPVVTGDNAVELLAWSLARETAGALAAAHMSLDDFRQDIDSL